MKTCMQKNRSLLLVSLLVSIVYGVSSVLLAKILQKAIDSGLNRNLTEFKQVVIFGFIFLVLFGLCAFVFGYLNKRLTNFLIRDYRQSIYSGIMGRSYQDFNQTNSADYISALTNDLKMVEENYIQSLILLFQNAVVFIATTIMLFTLSLKVSLALILSVLLMFIAPSFFGKKLQLKQEKVSTGFEKLTTQTKDILSGFEVIKTFHGFPQFRKIFDKENKQLTTTKLAADTLLTANESLSSILGTLCQFVVIFVSVYLIIQGEITAGTTVALIQLSGTFILPLVGMLTNFPKIKGITPVIEKLNNLAAYENKNKDGKLLTGFQNSLEVKNVSFAYDETKPVLKNIDLTLMKGKKYAILGKSGCGKSTLVKLLSGYYDTYEGQIKLDGENLKEVNLDSSEDLFSTIHQNVYMFDTSIEENITLGETYSTENMEQALRKSGVFQFTDSFPAGLKSPTGENGNKLSGGQRQRIAVARGLVRNTPILILDEGTSAIDRQTAYEIESQLLKIPELTILTITHQLSEDLLSQYDEIIYMADGRIVEQGSFSELINLQGAFSNSFQSTELIAS